MSAGRGEERLDQDLALVRALHESGAEDASEVSWASLVPHLDSRDAQTRLQALAQSAGERRRATAAAREERMESLRRRWSAASEWKPRDLSPKAM